MMRVEAAGERAECRHDDLGGRSDETAARDVPSLEVQPELGMEVAGNFRPRLLADGFVAKDDAADLDLLLDAAAAMVGEAGIVIADDPCPVEIRRKGAQQIARSGRQPFAAEAVMKTVAETVQPLCPGPLNLGRKGGESRMRIVRREKLPEPREPARLLEMQIGDQQRLLGRPEECAVSAWAK